VRSGKLDEAGVGTIATDFEKRYESLYGKGTGYREAGLQAITYRVFGTGMLPFKPELPEIAKSDGASADSALKKKRPMLLDPKVGWEDTRIYDYELLRAGHKFEGPAVVEAPTTTVVIGHNNLATVDKLGNIVITFE